MFKYHAKNEEEEFQVEIQRIFIGSYQLNYAQFECQNNI